LDLSGIRQRAHYGESFRGKLDIEAADLLQRAEGVMAREREVIRAQLVRNNVKTFSGCASFTSPTTIAVVDGDDRLMLEAPLVVIAVGTKPGIPSGLTIDHQTVLASDDLLHLKRLPRTMCVVGAGIIGVEYATTFGVLGVKVTLVDKRTELL